MKTEIQEKEDVVLSLDKIIEDKNKEVMKISNHQEDNNDKQNEINIEQKNNLDSIEIENKVNYIDMEGDNLLVKDTPDLNEDKITGRITQLEKVIQVMTDE